VYVLGADGRQVKMDYRDEELLTVGHKAFDKIAVLWQLSDEEKETLLGPLEERLERLSYIVGIYRALNIIFHTSTADKWITMVNTGPVMQCRMPLEVMLDEGLAGLSKVRRYLDAQTV
jgi:hypothetical protein